MVTEISAQDHRQRIDRNVRVGVNHPQAPRVQVVPSPNWCHPLPVKLWTDREHYLEGERVRIYIEPYADAWVYVYSTDGDGITRQIFPSYYDRDNFLRGGRVKVLPDRGYELKATGAGWDTLRVVAMSSPQRGWRPDFDYQCDARNPYPVFKGGYPEVRERLSGSLSFSYENYQRSYKQRGSNFSLRVEIGRPEPPRPCFGEDYTQIFVEPRYRPDYKPDYGHRPDYGHKPGYRPGHGSGHDRPDYKHFGTLEVSTSPRGADVYIDNRYYGRTPVEIKLPEGTYYMRVSNRGYLDEERKVKVVERRTQRLSMRLQRDHYYRPHSQYQYRDNRDSWSHRNY